MADRSFVHLHCHSHYSLLDGASRIPELVERAKTLGMNALALTDHGNLFGSIEFYRACKDAGLNPIIGYEAYVAPGKRTEREATRRKEAGFHLTLLARDNSGFKNLIKLASLAYLEGYYYVPRIDKEVLEAHKDGLICLSGCASNEFSEFILKDQMEDARRLAEWFACVFGKHFYVEIQNNGLPLQKQCADGAIAIANQLGLPLVATSDAHYLCQVDAAAHDVLLCINTGRKLSDANRMRYGSDQFYVRPPEEMYRLFPDHEAAVQRSQEIADGCHIELDFKKRHFPVFTPPDNKTPEQFLRELCQEGLHYRFGDNPPQAARDRLEHELGIICRMGFASYFLIVSDFVRFAMEHDIPCSARGSGCGAIVSYVLQLSHVDPLDYDLLFERFLDPNRSEAPDIDIDFCQDRREEVIAYVRRKYGEGSVAQIATFGTMAARAAIKDVGRVLDVPLERVNQLTDMIPKTLGITLDESLEMSGDLKQAYQADPQVRELIDIARKLEGTNRNAGTHAAGVVIANGPLTDYVPLQRVVRKGEEGGSRGGEVVVTTQWVMGDLEKAGMLKMDFLGLRTLTLLSHALRLIKKTRGETIDLNRLPLDDPETYQLLQRGDAKGVFQFESDGIRELLKRVKPDSIRDIIAGTALYRPGPLGGGMVDAYVNCKHGREKPTYPHPVMEEILAETYGVMVYQEQVMRILNRLGGIELSSAYACIKAISKKNEKIINQRREDFLKGAQERGVSKEVAEEIFEKIVFFGGYGFNKCLIGSTVLIDADSGERTTIESLFRQWRPFTIHALGEDGRLHPRPVTDVVWNGRKPVFELWTAQGRSITATANHPFRTLDGWVSLGDLRVGDRIAAARQVAPGRAHACEVWGEETSPLQRLGAKCGTVVAGSCRGGVSPPQSAPILRNVQDPETDSDLFWDRIVSIEPRGVQDTYDLTVAVDHNFVADGLIVHNSHSAAYAHVSYQTAYLKTHYTAEFMAALLSSEIEDNNKRDIMVLHIDDARRMGVEVLPPSVNASDGDFTVSGGRIIFGLTAIKGFGRSAADEIGRARAAGGPFKDIFDLCERLDSRAVNRAALERLIKAGAMDCFSPNRAQLLQVLPRALQAGSERQQDRRRGQKNLFDVHGGDGASTQVLPEESLPDVPPWSETEKLRYEKEVLDFYLSSHPLAENDRLLRRFASHTADEVKRLPADQEVTLGGMFTQITYRNTQKARNGNSRYLLGRFEDMTGSAKCVIWPDDFARCKETFDEDSAYIVKGRVDRSREEPTVVISQLLSLDQAQRELARGLWLLVRLERHSPSIIDEVARALRQTPGNCPVFLTVQDGAGKNTILRLGREFGIDPSRYAHEVLEGLLGPGCVKLA
jgi:DNA-directed DNA polymerase III PolC